MPLQGSTVARSDMFLKATGQRSGEIVGEANDKTFINQIDVVDWSWGMRAPSAVSGQRTGRIALNELKIVKRVDKSSTALMTVMSNNEVMTKVKLTVRKAGGSNQALPYLVVELTDARINSYNVRSEMGADAFPVLVEELALTFKTISIDYTPQTSVGGGGGASNFTGHAGPES
jgi:type VI secretion system secreted protein Hcp